MKKLLLATALAFAALIPAAHAWVCEKRDGGSVFPAHANPGDPHVWSGRALQENFDRDGGCAVLHQCIRPLIGALRAPGHHGYQRACDLVSGQASTGHVGHQGSHAPGRPILHLVSSPLADLGR